MTAQNNTLVVNGTGHRSDADNNYLKHSPKQMSVGDTFILTYMGSQWWQRAHHRMTAKLWELRKDDTYKHMVVISGMALGLDQLLIQCCLEVNERLAGCDALDIEPIIIIGAGVTKMGGNWWKESQLQLERLKKVVDHYYDVDILMECDDMGWGVRLNKRNEWMVNGYHINMFGLDDKVDAVAKHICLAAFDGRPGGTTNCIKYAMKNKATVMIFNPLLKEWMKAGEFRLLRSEAQKSAPNSPDVVFTKNDIFTSTCDAVVNPVNCKGALGKGLAKQFKEKTAHTTYETDYKAACKSGELVMGKPYVWKGNGKTIISLPTKNHWSSKSSLADIRESLIDIFKSNGYGLKSIAFPAIGCGLGGLQWDEVKPLLEKFAISMKNKKGVRIVIHEPSNVAQF